MTTGKSYGTIGVVNVNSGGVAVTNMDRKAVERIRELERKVEELEAENKRLEFRAKAAESRLVHARILGSAA